MNAHRLDEVTGMFIEANSPGLNDSNISVISDNIADYERLSDISSPLPADPEPVSNLNDKTSSPLLRSLLDTRPEKITTELPATSTPTPIIHRPWDSITIPVDYMVEHTDIVNDLIETTESMDTRLTNLAAAIGHLIDGMTKHTDTVNKLSQQLNTIMNQQAGRYLYNRPCPNWSNTCYCMDQPVVLQVTFF